MAKLNKPKFGRHRSRRAAKVMLTRLPSMLRLLARLVRDARVSALDKGVLVAVIGYVLTPIDLIPDFLGVVGFLDDLYLIGLALDRLLVRAPAHVVHEHWEGDDEDLDAVVSELDRLGNVLPGPIRNFLRGRVESGDEGAEISRVDDR